MYTEPAYPGPVVPYPILEYSPETERLRICADIAMLGVGDVARDVKGGA